MIYDKLENIASYEGIQPGIIAGLKTLRDTDFSKVEDGRYELDGDKLYMMVMTSDLKEVNDRPETHKKYIDIQYAIDGREDIGVASIDDVGEPVESKPEGDIWFYHADTVKLRLEGSRFIVLFPQDAHSPCISVDGDKKVRKAVIKVKV